MIKNVEVVLRYFISILFMLAVFVAGYAYAKGYYGAYKILKGTWIGLSEYRNDYFDLQVDLPDWWEFQEIKRNELSDSADNLEINFSNLGVDLEDLDLSLFYNAYPKVDDGSNDPTSLSIFIQKISVWSCEEYQDFQRLGYEVMGIDVIQFDRLEGEIWPSRKEFCRYDLSLGFPNGYVLRTRMLGLLKWPYAMTIQMSDSEHEYEYIERMLK